MRLATRSRSPPLCGGSIEACSPIPWGRGRFAADPAAPLSRREVVDRPVRAVPARARVRPKVAAAGECSRVGLMQYSP
jgi:hypothetical protein